MRRVITTMLFLVATAHCTSADPMRQEVDPFELEEDLSASAEDTWDEQTKDVEPPKGVREDDYTIEYPADTIPWAKPGYKVIFHKAAETTTYPPSHPSYPDRAKEYFSIFHQHIVLHPFLKEPDRRFDALRIQGWLKALKANTLRKLDSDEFIDSLPEYISITKMPPYYFAGVYAPDAFYETGEESEDVLHLFECDSRGRRDFIRLYDFGQFYFSCEDYSGSLLRIREEESMRYSMSCEATGYGYDIYKSHREPCEGDGYQELTQLEAVTWLGDELSHSALIKQGYSYAVEKGSAMGLFYLDHQCYPPLESYDEEACAYEKEHHTKFTSSYRVPSRD